MGHELTRVMKVEPAEYDWATEILGRAGMDFIPLPVLDAAGDLLQWIIYYGRRQVVLPLNMEANQ